MRSLSLGLLLGSLALCGCDSASDRAALEGQLGTLRAQLAERESFAQHLNEYRRDVERLEDSLKQMGFQPAYEKSTSALAAIDAAARGGDAKISSAGVVETTEDRYLVTVGLVGPGANGALVELLRKMPSATAKIARLGDKSSSLDLYLPRKETPQPKSPRFIRHRVALAPEPRFMSSELKSLREQIIQIERRTDELDLVLGDVVKLELRKKQLQGHLSAAEEANARADLLDALFTGTGPYGWGNVQFQGDVALVDGTPSSKGVYQGVDEVLPKGWRVDREGSSMPVMKFVRVKQ